jgi:hypothetical protein
MRSTMMLMIGASICTDAEERESHADALVYAEDVRASVACTQQGRGECNAARDIQAGSGLRGLQHVLYAHTHAHNVSGKLEGRGNITDDIQVGSG